MDNIDFSCEDNGETFTLKLLMMNSLKVNPEKISEGSTCIEKLVKQPLPKHNYTREPV